MKQSHSLLAVIALAISMLACNGINDVIGQRPARPSPTAPAFITATPGGRVSVLLTTDIPSVNLTPLPTATPFGEVIAPAATATVIAATRAAATAAAAVTPGAPLYISGECPEPAAPPPPAKPNAYSQYAESIGRYLSAGGPPTLLEGTLREWGAVNAGAVVQADTDLTGDSIPEIIVTIYDPASFKSDQPSPGELLVFSCALGGYRLIHSSGFSPGSMLPELRRVGDMNGDVRAEIAYSQKVCDDTRRCIDEMQILSWNAALGVFRPLNDAPMNVTNSRVAIADLDSDGVLEVAITYNILSDLAAGPQRRTAAIWDWDGVQYRIALMDVEPAVYRFHLLNDADQLFSQSDWRGAIRLYDRVRTDEKLQGWPVANEPIVLRSYATLKKIIAQMALDQRRTSTNNLQAMLSENPPGTPGESYALIAQAFVDSYNRRRDFKRACEAARNLANTRPDALIPLNSYGYANRTYIVNDFCQF